jgi:hypothetical protein
MARLLNELRLVGRRQGAAILLLHHPRKPNAEKPTLPLENPSPLEWLNEASGARAFINQTTTRIAFDRTRVLDENGEALGYRRLVGVELLSNAEQQTAFARLPEQFTFKQAKQTYGAATILPVIFF